MALPKINPLKTKSWRDLKNHFDEIKSYTISHFFDNDSNRFESFSINFGDLLVDYSKNRIKDKTLRIFENLTEEIKLDDAIESYFGGEKINETERRAVLHTAVRGHSDDTLILDRVDIMEKIKAEECDAIYIPKNKGCSEILFMLTLQHLCYTLALRKKIDPDKPKNLAKVVTVE